MSIDVMKQALEALDSDHPDIKLRAAIALRAAIEQAQEPVAWATTISGSAHELSWTKLSAELKAENLRKQNRTLLDYKYGVQPLYTAPRQWQGLTRQEFLVATQGMEDLEDCWMAIEAALKRKNNG